MFIDIDKLKTINDTKGHKIGDKAISQISTLIAKSIRQRDIAVRYGGDEFIIVVEELSGSRSTAYGLAKRLIREINKTKGKYITTISIGVHIFKVGDVMKKGISDIALHRSWEEQVVKADNLAYEAKKGGRNTLAFKE